jgi:lysophospholipase L1-like esterase
MTRIVAASLAFLMSAGIGAAAQAPAAQQPPPPQQAPSPAPSTPPARGSQEDAAARRNAAMQRLLMDWPNLARYKEENAQLAAPKQGESRVVFMGDSITDNWGRRVASPLFEGKPYVNRGIGGQTTPQMLVRFRQDVVALKPKVVVILAGINDIAENTGPTTLEAIEDNLASMTDLAQANGIRVVLASVTPALDFPWRPGKEPARKIVALNAWIRQFAASRYVVYLAYYSALVGADGGMKPGLSSDGVHPTAEGYAVMSPLAEQAIAEALKRPVK